MASKKVGNIVSVTGTYEGRDGEERKSYHRWGTMFQRDDGSLFGKVQLPWGESWFNVYPDREGEEQAPEARPSRAKKKAAPKHAEAEFDNDIPF